MRRHRPARPAAAAAATALAAALALVAALELAGAAMAPASASARGLATGFADPLLASSATTERGLWLDRSLAAAPRVVRYELNWRSVAPLRPGPSFRAADPGDPGYRWEWFDRRVEDATRRGLRVLVTFLRAPRWAEGAGAGSFAGQGSWRPSPAMLADFAAAAARRYSGAYVDRSGRRLPNVRLWQIWNEPNLETYLAPQGSGRGASFRPTSGNHYRRMLNAAYHAIKGVDRRNVVLLAGTGPYGDLTGRRTQPASFMRQLLCVSGRRRPRAGRCPEAAHFDVQAHHPYSVGGPRRRALGLDDVAVPDLHKLTRVVAAAVRGGTALPRRRKPLWITEVSWDSRPPDPDGVPVATHARWVADTLELLWRQGAEVVVWFLLADQPRGLGWEYTYQAGVLFADGRAKPALRAFRFPLVARRVRRGRVRIWARPPVSGRVVLERRRGRRWVRLGRARRRGARPFSAVVRLRGRALVRARVRGEPSLARWVR